MDSVKHLFSFFLKIAFGIFFLVLIMWLVSVIPRTPVVVTKTATSTLPKTDFLPSPRKYSGFLTNNANKPGAYGNTFVAPAPYVYSGAQGAGDSQAGGTTHPSNAPSYNSYDYSEYPTTLDASGKYVIGTKKSGTPLPANTVPDSSADRGLTIRNLSIYEGGHVYTGLSFVGDARSSMFRDGKFPIVVIDGTGRLVGVSYGVAKTVWSVPGWVRFETKITYPLPSNVPCTMIFEEALTQVEKTRAPLRVPIPIKCN